MLQLQAVHLAFVGDAGFHLMKTMASALMNDVNFNLVCNKRLLSTYAHAHTESQCSFQRPFPEVTSSQHPSRLLNSHHFCGHSGIIGPNQEAPGLRAKHFMEQSPPATLQSHLYFFFSGLKGRGRSPPPTPPTPWRNTADGCSQTL